MEFINTYLTPVSTIIFVIFGVFGYGWLKILKETNSLLKEQNEELKVANKELADKHDQALKQLALMQGQIDVLKSVPLTNIDTTLQNLEKFNKSLAESNTKILDRLEKSAITLAQNTKSAAKAVKEVKEDLA